MDLLASLLNPNKTLEFIRVPSAQVHTVITPQDEPSYDDESEEEDNRHQDYAKVYQERETSLYAKAVKERTESHSHLTDIHSELVSTACATEVQQLHLEQLSEVFNKFNFDRRRRQNLTIDLYREHITNMISVNEVVVIQGPTGCGKSTQVPQFILDDFKSKNKLCNIVVTQPRRIAAISVARRVCEERGWGMGTVCGYQVGLERCAGPDTILSYVTTGVLLQKLIHTQNLHDYTHIIIDEVHERNQDMDFLLLVIRKFLFLNSPHVKVILMSATFDTNEFAVYFNNYSGRKIISAPVISINKPNLYNTVFYYTDQMGEFLPIPHIASDKPEINKKTYELFVFLVRALDNVDSKEPQVDVDGSTQKIGSVLAFLPGILEIEEAYDQLKATEASLKESENAHQPRIKWQIVPLHSSLTSDEQRKVFEPANPGCRKIILSTNIAESSITVPDIVYVIDFCLTKTMVVDSLTKYQSLQLNWASQVNCIQRAGRVGRICDGRVYRLVSRDFYERELPKTITPEIRRAPLDRIVLASKMLNLNEPPEAILALALDPPDLKNVESTVWFLKECGALTVKCRGCTIPGDGDLTFLGRVMAQLPIDVTLSKFLVLGHMFSCLTDCIIMAAGASLDNIFRTPFQERMAAYNNKLMWSDGSCSDMIALLNLYKVWERNKRNNAFTYANGEAGWLKQNYVTSRALKEWQILIKELTDRLDRLQIRESTGAAKVVLTYVESPLVLKIAMCGAFYPNYFVRAANAGQVDEREAVKVLGGRDPLRTVYLTNMESEQPGPLYAGAIKGLFRDLSENVRVTFDKGQKVFVQFSSGSESHTVNVQGQQLITNMAMPGKVLPEVYQAVRRRQLNLKHEIFVFPKRVAWVHANELGITEGLRTQVKSEDEAQERSVLPGMDQEYISIKITEHIDAGHFWAQNVNSETDATLFVLDKMLNDPHKEPLEPVTEQVKINELYAAKYEDGLYYRCKIVHVRPARPPKAQILYIDYGNTQSRDITDLRLLPEAAKKKQPQAMECVLSETRPSLVLSPHALWSKKTNEEFKARTQDVELYGKVYSVVDSVVHLELYRTNPLGVGGKRNISINEWLIQMGFGEPTEESYLSRENHTKRLAVQQSEDEGWRYEEQNGNEADEPEVELKARGKQGAYPIYLKGPFSPLEMQIYGLTNSSESKRVRVDPNSVNTVLLDTDPQDPHARLIVAASIGQTADAGTLKLRHSTIMPNIHGFLAMVTLIFCPKMEPKPTADGSKIAAILCGLGPWEDTNKALYPPHDLLIALDTELTNTELGMINQIRYCMNFALTTMEQLKDHLKNQRHIESCQKELKTKLFELLKYKRKNMERMPFKFGTVWNKAEFDYEILQADNATENDTDIWPAHWTIKLTEFDQKKILLKQNLVTLTDMAMRMIPATKIMCECCETELFSLNDIRLHICSEAHKQKVHDLKLQ